MAGTKERKKRASKPSKPKSMMCKSCNGKGYKEEFSISLGVMSRWRCLVCNGAGKIGLPDYPLITILLDMLKCGLCTKHDSEKATCHLGVRNDNVRLDGMACSRIFEYFVGENTDGDSVPQS